MFVRLCSSIISLFSDFSVTLTLKIIIFFQAFYDLDEVNSKKMTQSMMIKLLKKWAINTQTALYLRNSQLFEPETSW